MNRSWQAGVVASLALGLTVALVAQAQPVDAPSASADAHDRAPARLRCRTFPVTLGEQVLDTHDLDSELGQWVEGLEAQGWELSDVDFEVVQKPTGFAQGWSQVCVTPRRC